MGDTMAVNKYTGGKPIEEAEKKTESFAKGGKAKKRAKGGTCGGDMPSANLAKRARGGVLSAAANPKGRPGGKYDGEVDKSND